MGSAQAVKDTFARYWERVGNTCGMSSHTSLLLSLAKKGQYMVAINICEFTLRYIMLKSQMVIGLSTDKNSMSHSSSVVYARKSSPT